MSAATQTRIFGVRLGLDPKILVGALVALAGLLFWYNSRGDEETGGASRPAAAVPVTPAAVPGNRTRAQTARRRNGRDDRGTLRLQNIDASHGDVDPELRLDLLERVAKVPTPSLARNLFEAGPAAQAGGAFGGLPNRVITPKPLSLPPVTASYPVMPKVQANIPLKYYGFVRPVNSGDGNRGFFLDGDNILVATEGQLVQQRYLVVQLNPLSARLEDTQIKLGQTLPVVPEALEQGGGFARPINPGFQQPDNSSDDGSGEVQPDAVPQPQPQPQPTVGQQPQPGIGPGGFRGGQPVQFPNQGAVINQ